MKQVSSTYSHLENLVLADSFSKINKKIDILIGTEHYYRFIFGNVIRGKVNIPWLKRTFWSVFLPKSLDWMFQIPGRMFQQSGQMFFYRPGVWLKTSGRVFYIKNSQPSVLNHPPGCLNFKHPTEQFTNAFEIWS